jgi:alkylhydroperoxidase family enzyme
MLGRSIGLSNREIAEMEHAEASELFDETDRLVLRYAEVLTRELKVSDALYAALAQRFPKDELIELCFSVALAALVNRVHATFRTDVDESTLEAVGDASFCTLKP